MSRSPSPFPHLPLAPPFPFFHNFSPSAPFLDMPPAASFNPGPPSAGGLPEVASHDSGAPSGDKVLPRGVDLPTMISSPELQMAWHAHLVSTNQHREAEALRNLLSRGQGPPMNETLALDSSSRHLEGHMIRPAHTQSPDSGCFSSPPDTNKPQAIVSDSLAESMFEELLTDFESSWPASTVLQPSTAQELSVPLYMRRAHSEERRREEEICVLDESILAFALETQPDPSSSALPISTHPHHQPPFSPALIPRSREPQAPLSYAGVLRTPPKTAETTTTDPIQKIRNLGAVGSQVL